MHFVIVLMQDLTAKTKSQQIKGKKDQVAKIVYTEEGNGKVRQSLEYVDSNSESKEDFGGVTIMNMLKLIVYSRKTD